MKKKKNSFDVPSRHLAKQKEISFPINFFFPAKTGTFSLLLTVNDTNDHKPYCSPLTYSVTLSEDALGGSTVGQLNCSDDDATAPNNELVYIDVSLTGNRK